MINWNIMSGKAVRKNILSYITRNHPCAVVDSIENTSNTYNIRLMNGKALIFNSKGVFLRTLFLQ